MESNMVECEEKERCGSCRSDPPATLAVLQDVHRAYEERMEVIERLGGARKLQMQVEVLRAWVGDLVGQNTLLARAVRELETEATSRLMMERTRHAEAATEAGSGRHTPDEGGLQQKQTKPAQSSRRRPGSRDVLCANDALQKENNAKDREIRRLTRDIQKYEQTIVSLRSEMSHNSRAECPKKDAEVMAGMCFPAECGALEPVNYGSLLADDAAKYQERIRSMEQSLKSSSDSVRALRKVNVALSEELHALRRVCAALDEQCRATSTRMSFKDDIIREMRRQLKQAKTKLKESGGSTNSKSHNDLGEGESKLRSSGRSFESVHCVQPRRSHVIARVREVESPLHPDSDDCRSPRLDGSGDDVLSERGD